MVPSSHCCLNCCRKETSHTTKDGIRGSDRLEGCLGAPGFGNVLSVGTTSIGERSLVVDSCFIGKVPSSFRSSGPLTRRTS